MPNIIPKGDESIIIHAKYKLQVRCEPQESSPSTAVGWKIPGSDKRENNCWRRGRVRRLG